MPHLIFKCPYIKGGPPRAAARLGNYVRYMATREGAQRVPQDTGKLPATQKQQELVERLLRDFPLSRGMFEYEDYALSSTRANASAFITRVLENNYDKVAKKENYVSYIANRPRAQRTGTHALFTDSNDPLVLSQVADAVARHPGNVWLPIFSLRREDAARLGYDSAESWKKLLCGYAMEMAQAMKIPWDQFRWYAAFHDEGHHPHVHMYATAPTASPGISPGTGSCKSSPAWPGASSDRNSTRYMNARPSGGTIWSGRPARSWGNSSNRCGLGRWRTKWSNSSWSTWLRG